MDDTKILSIDEIVSDSEARHGRPIILGTSICISDVAGWYLSGDRLTVQQISENYHLSLGQVCSVLSYYYLHQTDFDGL